MLVTEAQEAWWPPTFKPSRLGRRWLALWIIQADNQSSFCSTVANISCFPNSEPSGRISFMPPD